MKLTRLSNTTLRIIFGKKRDELNTSELHNMANILSPWQQTYFGPAKLLHSISYTKLPASLCQEITENLGIHQRTQNWTFKANSIIDTGKIRLPYSEREASKFIYPPMFVKYPPHCLTH